MAPADRAASCRAARNTVGRFEVQAFRLGHASSDEGEAGKMTEVGATHMREAVNALLHLLTTGCRWRLSPKEFPPFSTVQRFFTAGGTLGCGRRSIVEATDWIRRQQTAALRYR